MLGRLLHLGSGGSSAAQFQPQGNASRPVSSLESVQEDIHTRNLLFPDTQALYQHRNDQVFPLSTAPPTPSAASGNAFDYREDSELDVRHVRVVVMQDALGPSNASLLFDSHPAPPSPPAADRSPPGQESRRAAASSRKGSLNHPSRPLVIQSSESPQMYNGAFDRRSSMHGRSHSFAETEAQRAWREYREELATFSSCIFGNSELMSYKGTSTKVHVVPSETRNADFPASLVGDGRSSIGRSSARSSKLSQSYSSQAISPSNVPSLPHSHTTTRQADRKKVLITRLFPVNLTTDVDASSVPPSHFTDDNGGFPFPSANDEGLPKKKKPQPKQRRIPMYAVALVVQLPPSSRVSPMANARSAFRESGSYNDQDFFPSSYGSTRPSGFSMAGSGTYGEATDSVYSLDVEDRIDALTQHWDIIMRTLTHLQSVVATSLGILLRQVDIGSPDPQSISATNSFAIASERRSGETSRSKPSKSTTKLVFLPPNCLADNNDLSGQVDSARRRIVAGLSASRVVTGQGRWGIWREEAIWTSKWAQETESGPFFFNVLTGFLATHTDWMQALSPPLYRRRLLLNRRGHNEEDLSLPSRTIIVSDNKMAARRLVFLLAAFFPANQQLAATRPHRPSTAASIGTFSHSPPTYVVPVLREESLRRKINRRTGARRASHSRTMSQSTRASAVPSQLAQLNIERGHERRVSDAGSIRAGALPMPGHDFVSRKSSAATTATIMPEAAAPHFSSVKRADSFRRPRPGSGGSVAAADLKRSLTRDSSTTVSDTDPETRNQGSKWGSVISGLWSTRRRGSASISSLSQDVDPKSPIKGSLGRPERLTDMVREVSESGTITVAQEARIATPDAHDVKTPRESSTGRIRESFSQTDRMPNPAGAFESPVKTSINADDGVIDVDVPFPDYIASFESAISSPSSSGYLSTPALTGGLDFFENSARVFVDGDVPLNAAGWLKRYHPDFALQAIAPQEDLLEQVKASLRAEPTPPPVTAPDEDMTERWVDVGSAMIADTTTNTVSRILYRRLIKPKAPVERSSASASNGANVYGGALLTPSILPYENQLEEEWIEDLVMRPDEAVADAMSKVVSLNFDSSTVNSSAASSQTHSEMRGSSDEEGGGGGHNTSPFETPRLQCKTVVLSALEDIIRDVIEQKEKHNVKYVDSRRDLLRAAVRSWLAEFDANE